MIKKKDIWVCCDENDIWVCCDEKRTFGFVVMKKTFGSVVMKKGILVCCDEKGLGTTVRNESGEKLMKKCDAKNKLMYGRY